MLFSHSYHTNNLKVFLHYEDNQNKLLHKSLKITLPKKWKSGPNKLYSDSERNPTMHLNSVKSNPLDAASLHLAHKVQSEESISENDIVLTSLASDATVMEVIDDRVALYMCHGASQT